MTKYVSNLQDLANQWGREFSKRHGTTCKWVDLHAKQHDMAKYQQNKIAAKVANVRYEEKGTTIDVPGAVITDDYTNNSSSDQSSTFKYNNSTSNSFSWSLNEGIDVGIAVKFAVGVPPIVAGSTTLSTNISFEATQSKTESETKAWSIDRNIIARPRTKIDMIWTIKQQKSSATFHADIIMTGHFAIWNNDKIDVHNPGGSDRHWLWFIPITTAFRQMREWGMSVPPQYFISDSSVTYTASGECQGEVGVGTTFDVEETPLPDKDTAATKTGISKIEGTHKIIMFAIPAKN